MNSSDQDDLAKLAFGIATDLKLPIHEAKETIASMFGVSEDESGDLIEQGKRLAKLVEGRAA
jgi:hypothetical protein